MTGMGRRDALRLIGATPLAVGFGIGASEAAAAGTHADLAVQAATKGQAYRPRFFTAHEWDTLRILVDMIIPKDERSGSATDAGVPEFMDFLMSDPADSDRSREVRQTAMRGGLAWIDATCHRRFGSGFLGCAEAERIAVLDEIAYVKSENDERPDKAQPEDLQVRIEHGPAFFNSFRDLTASGFWSSKMGIADLQYKGNSFVAKWEDPPPEVLARLGVTSR